MFWRKKKEQPALYFSLNREVEYAQARGEQSFYYPLREDEVDKAMAWGAHRSIGIKPDHITDGVTYYKFYGWR